MLVKAQFWFYDGGMSSDARAMAAAYYRNSDRSMAADMAALSRNPQGVVLFLPQLVVLAKPAAAADRMPWADLAHSPAGAEAWYIHLLAGDLSLALRLATLLPPRRWLCFQRGCRHAHLHCYPWARLRRAVPCHNTLNQERKPIPMGFAKKPASPPTTSIPVVTESATEETEAAYQQQNSKKKGLLASIIADKGRAAGQDTPGSNTTLG